MGQKVLLKLKGRPQQKGPAQKLRPERAGPFRILEVVHPNVAMRLDMSRVHWKGHDIFHVSQLTPYFDGTDLFPSRTPESLQSCDVAHLDGWEADDIEYAVNELKASRMNTKTRKMEWFVSWKGFAADDDMWIGASQMNDLLRTEADQRAGELHEEGLRLARLESLTTTQREAQQNKRRRRKRGRPAGTNCPMSVRVLPQQ